MELIEFDVCDTKYRYFKKKINLNSLLCESLTSPLDSTSLYDFKMIKILKKYIYYQ